MVHILNLAGPFAYRVAHTMACRANKSCTVDVFAQFEFYLFYILNTQNGNLYINL